MEKIPYLIVLIILALTIIVAVVLVLKMIRGSANETTISLEKACLELIKNGCDESIITIDSKSFEEICKRNNLEVDECKKFCGC
ncbi:MAG: hypothetical protein QW472_02915 [Candidatus Aenigmatarchaeota archaeon]